jgi:hypothetical protein
LIGLRRAERIGVADDTPEGRRGPSVLITFDRPCVLQE